MVSLAHNPDWQQGRRGMWHLLQDLRNRYLLRICRRDPLQIRCRLSSNVGGRGCKNPGILRASGWCAQPPGEISLLNFCRLQQTALTEGWGLVSAQRVDLL